MIILNENKSLQKIYLKDQVVEQWSWLSQTNGQITILPSVSTVGFREFLEISPFVDDYFSLRSITPTFMRIIEIHIWKSFQNA